MDGTNEAAVEEGVDRALADFGGAFPIIVHNAKRHEYSAGRMPEIRTAVWRGALAVHLGAALFFTRALLRRAGALPRGSSLIVATFSGQAQLGTRPPPAAAIQ